MSIKAVIKWVGMGSGWDGMGSGWVGGVPRFSNIEHIRVRECVQCPFLANHRPRCLCVHQSEAATVM